MVYFITDGEYVKIGKASCVVNRLKSLQTGNARRLRVLYVYEGGYDVERIMHKIFKNYRVDTSEWFRINESHIYEILKGRKRFSDTKIAVHKAELVNRTVYNSKVIVKRIRTINKSNVNKNIIIDVKKMLRKSKVISYRELENRYKMKKEEISFIIKSVGMSGKVYTHNQKFMKS